MYYSSHFTYKCSLSLEPLYFASRLDTFKNVVTNQVSFLDIAMNTWSSQYNRKDRL